MTNIPFSKTINKVVRIPPIAGDIGIEIEVESTKRLPELSVQSTAWWQTHLDNSLRGYSLEYVLGRPIRMDQVREALAALRKDIPTNNYLRFSNRTSVHVHINVSGITLLNLYSYIVLYTILEDLLIAWSGPSRFGNLFCLGMKDANGIPLLISQGLVTGFHIKKFGQDNIRYGSLNLNAVYKFGSCEFRSMEGTVDMSRIEAWCRILLNLREHAVAFKDPREIIEEFSVLGARLFVEKHVPEIDDFLTRDIEVGLHESMRIAQDIAFASNWEDTQAKAGEYGGRDADFVIMDDLDEPENRIRRLVEELAEELDEGPEEEDDDE